MALSIKIKASGGSSSEGVRAAPFTALHKSRFEILCSQNPGVLDSLVAEYGSSVINDTWNKIRPDIQEKFIQGEISLSDHLEEIKDRAFKILVRAVKTLNEDDFKGVPVKVLESVLGSKTASELQALIPNTPELDKCKQELALAKVAYENKALLRHFARAYSKEIVVAAYESLFADHGDGIKNGTFRLEGYIDDLRKKCDEISSFKAKVGELPPKEELLEFFKTARVTKCIERSGSIFFVEGMHKGQVLQLVIKDSVVPAKESFGTHVVTSVGVRTPDTQIVNAKDEKDLLNEIRKCLMNDKKGKKYLEKRNIQKLTVMTYVPGITLEVLSAKDIQTTSAKDLDLIYDRMLFEIGQIASADFLLYYRDRLSTIGMGNLENLMILQDEVGACIGAVGIDQVASLSNGATSMDVLMGIGEERYEKIYDMVLEIAADPGAISKPARDIYENSFSESVKELLDETKALEAIQRGLVSGLARVITCSEESLTALHMALPIENRVVARAPIVLDGPLALQPGSPFTRLLNRNEYGFGALTSSSISHSSRDAVDLEAHLQMLRTIRSALLQY